MKTYDNETGLNGEDFTVTYKNYKGFVEYDRESDYYFGYITEIKDLVQFGGRTPKEVYNDFVYAIADYEEMKRCYGLL